MATNVARLLNVGLRFANLGTRFLFIFFLAKYLDPASVGYYGIFAATVGYCLYFVGFDFYTYVTREILRTPMELRGRLLMGQVRLSGALYLIFLPLAVALLNQTDWPGHLVFWFLPILVLEHFNLEIYRFLITISEQLTATTILLAQQGSWAVVMVALMVVEPGSRNLDVVMALWACAGGIAAALGFRKVRKLRMGGWRQPTDWAWIKKGINVSGILLVATLALRGIHTLDRYWLEALVDIELVAAYVLLLGVASTLLVFLDAGVFAFAYPALIKCHHEKQHDAARNKVRKMLMQTIFLSATFAVISWFILPLLLDWINNPVYSNAVGLYPWLLLAVIINGVGLVPHYALYAKGNDRPIIQGHMAALLTFVVATWLFSTTYPTLAVPIGINFAFLVILVWKTIAYLRLNSANHTSP